MGFAISEDVIFKITSHFQIREEENRLKAPASPSLTNEFRITTQLKKNTRQGTVAHACNTLGG